VRAGVGADELDEVDSRDGTTSDRNDGGRRAHSIPITDAAAKMSMAIYAVYVMYYPVSTEPKPVPSNPSDLLEDDTVSRYAKVTAITRAVHLGSFLPRDGTFARYMLSSCVCLSVYPSVKRRYCTRTAKHKITETSPYDSTGPL